MEVVAPGEKNGILKKQLKRMTISHIIVLYICKYEVNLRQKLDSGFYLK